MIEGKESAGYVLPFFAGNVTGIFLCGYRIFHADTSWWVAATSFAACTALLFIWIGGNLRLSRPCRDTVLISAVFFCGLFCWSNQSLGGLSDTGTSVDIARRATQKAGIWLKESIDSLPLMDYSSNALIKALVTGDRSDVSYSMTATFRDSGVSHILALSGMHLGVIYLILTKLLSVLGRAVWADILRYAIIVAASLFYSVMTGASPSIVRAFLFILLRETAKICGRKARPVNILCMSLTIQAALNPPIIMTASFQLSYLAMCGIYFLYPYLRDFYPEPVPVLKKLWNSVALSISCQVFTGPLAWVIFGSAPVYFIITNLIAVPITSALMPVALLAVFLRQWGICPEILISAIDFSTELVVDSLEIICTLP